MTDNEQAFFGLCFVFWQQGLILWCERVAMTTEAINAATPGYRHCASPRRHAPHHPAARRHPLAHRMMRKPRRKPAHDRMNVGS